MVWFYGLSEHASFTSILSLSVGRQSVSVSAMVTATAVSEPPVSAVVSVTVITGLQIRRHFRLRPKPEKVVSVGLYGISGSLLDRLQSVMNAVARLVFSARRSEHVTPLLRDLHWLKVPDRVKCVATPSC